MRPSILSVSEIVNFFLNVYGFLVRGVGYPDLWPSLQCIEPLDVSKNYTFEVIDGIIGGSPFPLNIKCKS